MHEQNATECRCNKYVLVDVSPSAVQSFIMALKGLAKIVKDCFFTSNVSISLSDDIKEPNSFMRELNSFCPISSRTLLGPCRW